MITNAKTIQCAAEAGLRLVGKTKDRKPDYTGSAAQWARYAQLVHWVEECNMFPWIYPFSYEAHVEVSWPRERKLEVLSTDRLEKVKISRI